MSELTLQVTLNGPDEFNRYADVASLRIEMRDELFNKNRSPSKKDYLYLIATELRKVAERWNTIADAINLVEARRPRQQDDRSQHAALAWKENGQPAEIIREDLASFIEERLERLPKEIRKRFTVVSVGGAQ